MRGPVPATGHEILPVAFASLALLSQFERYQSGRRSTTLYPLASMKAARPWCVRPYAPFVPGLMSPEQVDTRTVISSPARAAASMKYASVSNWSWVKAPETRSARDAPARAAVTSLSLVRSPAKSSTFGSAANLAVRGSSSLRLHRATCDVSSRPNQHRGRTTQRTQRLGCARQRRTGSRWPTQRWPQ